ncbi:MAG: hypothetical protein RL685_583 [Pseudomonadota bacterium]|jgi:superfamily II DNA or RNA helicase/HKD family nuclease/SOS-response transcriptional repressor LexA
MSAPLASNELAIAVRAAPPSSPGHTLVSLRRAIPSYFDATKQEKAALWALVDEVKALLDQELHPTGYAVSFQVGQSYSTADAATHIHIVPCFGTPPAPSFGITRQQPLATGGDRDPLEAQLWPLFAHATDIAIVAAFVTETGLDVLEPSIFAALRAGARVRIVTGDYLGFNQVDALRQLLGWSQLELDDQEDAGEGGELRVRIVETALADGTERAFHPKAWLFESSGSGAAFVGSSNVSRSALQTGIEWNLRVERGVDPLAFACVRGAVDTLWASALELTPAWLDAYARRVRLAPRPPPAGEADDEALQPPPEPHLFQQEALAALAQARSDGRKRALVVLATGLGKTWLAAYDVLQVARELERWPRVLFLAHRGELLAQAALTFRRLLASDGRADEIGWCAGDLMQPEASVVVASVQKLQRAEHLQRVAEEGFDYVIVDEVHHADAPTYRRVLERLQPRFLLGLTATPDRADEGDILGLFDDYVAYRADLGAGIAGGRLVPFAYFGVRDDIDYAQIPWRNRRFDPTALALAVQTQSRMAQLWRAWQEHPGTRTLVFCCSIEHARFAASWLAERGVRTAAVFAASGSDDRTESVLELARGELDAVCAVDLFNEGVDIPEVDRVVMLRPTESPVVFLQQLGRGLRRHEGKPQLTIIDFVGNHRMFVDRIRRLFSLVSPSRSLQAYLESGTQPQLPPGCSVELELEAKELLQSLFPAGGQEVTRAYRELRLTRNQRPSAGELYRMGYRPSTLRQAHGNWFHFVAAEGDLAADELQVLRQYAQWLDLLEGEATPPAALPLLALESILDADALSTGIALSELARRGHELLQRSPELQRELERKDAIHLPASPTSEWRALWQEKALAPWLAEGRWFAIDGDRFVPRRLAVSEESSPALLRMTRELVDYGLQRHRARAAQDTAGSGFRCTLTWNKRDPILKLPSRKRVPDCPSDETAVRLPDGSVWTFRFAKEYCNVAYPVGTTRNRLADLLHGWFGPNAGHPGTRFEVSFSRSPDGWWIEPIASQRVMAARGELVAYPSLRAAAGDASDGRGQAPEAERVTLPFTGATDGVFAVRASGDSMDGGKTPIKDGDWLVMRWDRGASAGSVEGRVVLIETRDAQDTFAYQVKRLVQQEGGWWLRSDNPQRTSFAAAEGMTVIARLMTTVSPEALAPPVGERLSPDAVAAAFGLPPELSLERTGRFGGHLFLLVEATGMFTEPDRLSVLVNDKRPGETAFVLARTPSDETWRYCGIARWLHEESQWTVPELDFATWRALGEGRDCSRRLPTAAKDRANAQLDELLRRILPGEWLQHGAQRCRLVARTAKGVRIDGGEGGFAERTVSITDLAWVILTAEDVAKNGGLLDEVRVNRLRYLQGTPKGSTRWIDTGWAIAIFGNTSPKSNAAGL